MWPGISMHGIWVRYAYANGISGELGKLARPPTREERLCDSPGIDLMRTLQISPVVAEFAVVANVNQKLNRVPATHRRLRICPMCFGLGYHSVCHQFHALAKCPIHQQLLVSECHACGAPFPFAESSFQSLHRTAACAHCGMPLAPHVASLRAFTYPPQSTLARVSEVSQLWTDWVRGLAEGGLAWAYLRDWAVWAELWLQDVGAHCCDMLTVVAGNPGIEGWTTKGGYCAWRLSELEPQTRDMVLADAAIHAAYWTVRQRVEVRLLRSYRLQRGVTWGAMPATIDESSLAYAAYLLWRQIIEGRQAPQLPFDGWEPSHLHIPARAMLTTWSRMSESMWRTSLSAMYCSCFAWLASGREAGEQLGGNGAMAATAMIVQIPCERTEARASRGGVVLFPRVPGFAEGHEMD